MEIPTKTCLPCVTGGLCCQISCSFSFKFTLDPIKLLPPGVCNEKSMGWGAPKVFRTETIFAHGQYHVDVDRLYCSRRTLCLCFSNERYIDFGNLIMEK